MARERLWLPEVNITGVPTTALSPDGASGASPEQAVSAASVSSMSIFNFIIFNFIRLLRVGGLIPIEVGIAAATHFFPFLDYGNEADCFFLYVDFINVVRAALPSRDIVVGEAFHLAVFE